MTFQKLGQDEEASANQFFKRYMTAFFVAEETNACEKLASRLISVSNCLRDKKAAKASSKFVQGQ